MRVCIVPFFNSIVTVSLAHFIKNLSRDLLALHVQPIGKEKLAQFLAPEIFHHLNLPNELHVGGGKVREAVSVNMW